jgi:hypothetical protein
MSNKKYDLTASISTEDVNGPEILHAYHSNQLIDFNDKDGRIVENHKYYKYIDYYFNKTIQYSNGIYTCKKDTIVLIFRNRFLHLINNKNKK